MGAFTKLFSRLRITSDPNVSTQTSAVITADSGNTNLVIAPSGTGALIADIPDGTATGGNPRGNNAVDLQTSRSILTQVASGTSSVIVGGSSNTATANHTVVGGQSNTASSTGSVVFGRSNSSGGDDGVIFGNGNTISGASSQSGILSGNANTVSSARSVVCGGQNNTASTNTHATVCGGFTNTASGGYSTVSGGQSNVASGSFSFAHGFQTVASALGSGALNNGIAQSNYSMAINGGSVAPTSGTNNGTYAFAHGASSRAYLYAMQANAGGSFSGFGQSQQSYLTARREASLNSGITTILSLDGTGTTNLIVPEGNNRLWAVKVVATAFVSVAGGTLVLGDSYMGEFTMLFKRVGGTSSVVGVNSANLIYDTNMATAAFTFAAGASQDLQITFKAPTTASATTFRCVAKVELVEVAY